MKADATAEKRPACLVYQRNPHMLAGATHKYQGGIEIIVVFYVKVLVVFVRLFSELFVEARLRVWPLLRESRFDRGSQVIAQSMHNMRP